MAARGNEAREMLFSLLKADRPGELLAGFSDLPFLSLAARISAGPPPYHSGSVLKHTARCMNEVAGDPLAVWMAMTHDAGKLTTPAAMLPHHYGHELRGMALAAVWADTLGLDADMRLAGILSAGLHMRGGRYLTMRPGKKYKLLMAVHPTFCAASFWKVVDADAHAEIGAVATRHWQLLQEARNLPLQRQIELLRRQG